MRRLLSILVLLICNLASSQRSTELNNYLLKIKNALPEYIHTSNGTTILLNSLKSLKEDAESGTLVSTTPPDERDLLNSIIKKGAALTSFVKTVGQYTSFLPYNFEEEEMQLLKDSLSIPFTIIDSAKHCLQLYEVNFGEFKALLGVLKREGEKRVEVEVKVKYHKTSQESGAPIFPNKYYRFWSNAQDLQIREYVVDRVRCG